MVQGEKHRTRPCADGRARASTLHLTAAWHSTTLELRKGFEGAAPGIPPDKAVQIWASTPGGFSAMSPMEACGSCLTQEVVRLAAFTG